MDFSNFEKHPLYFYIKGIVDNYFAEYKNIYAHCGLDYKDLLQESYLVALNTLQKKEYVTKPLLELKKLVSQVVGWRLKRLKKVTKDNVFVTFNSDLANLAHIKAKTELAQLPVEAMYFDFNEIKQFMDARAYKIFYARFKENKTFVEIGTTVGLSHKQVSLIYNQNLKKLRKHFFETK